MNTHSINSSGIVFSQGTVFNRTLHNNTQHLTLKSNYFSNFIWWLRAVCCCVVWWSGSRFNTVPWLITIPELILSVCEKNGLLCVIHVTWRIHTHNNAYDIYILFHSFYFIEYVLFYRTLTQQSKEDSRDPSS